MNKAIIIGRITKDIELKYTKNERQHIEFTVAVSRDYKNAEGEYETDFITVDAWGFIAENTASYCKKGDLIGVSGSLRHDTYESEDGTKQSKDYILAEKITFLSAKKD